MEGFICDITLIISDFKISINMPAAFLENPLFDALLGQRYFFERFNVKFEKNKNKFHLSLVK